MEINAQELSRQQQKSRETKARIFNAAKQILQEQGYEALSIKNICEAAGVSNGSFYHHFKTKDDLLSYYIEEQPSINPDYLDLPGNAEEAKTAIIRVYLNYVHYCRELGVAFMSNYYTPKNQSLNPLTRTDRPCTRLSETGHGCRRDHLTASPGRCDQRHPDHRHRKCLRLVSEKRGG